MIALLVTANLQNELQELINKEYRLNELVQLTTDTGNVVIKVTTHIEVLPDWENTQPPVLLPIISYDKDALLGIIYAKLDNYEKAYELLRETPDILQPIDLSNRLQNAVSIDDFISNQTAAIDLHNKAIAMHYGSNHPISENTIVATYENAISLNDNVEQRLFSTYHLTQYHIDLGNTEVAEKLIESTLSSCSQKKITIAFKDLLCKIGLKKINIPYDMALLEKVKTNLWECLEYYEANNRTVEMAMVLMDASHIATISNSFSEALGYINRAIALFETEHLDELTAQAHFTKGNLLQTWAQNGNPQFFRTSVQAYQAALRTFTKEDAPDIFAEIQHQLGKVYAEIPDEAKKERSMGSDIGIFVQRGIKVLYQSRFSL